MPRAADLLKEKRTRGGAGVVSVGPEATVLDAAKLMNAHRIGAVLVVDGEERLLGIFTERDVMTRVVARELTPQETRVSAVMTTPVDCCGPRTVIDELRTMMRERRIRHVPVVENGEVLGMVSIGDLNAAEQKVMIETINYLEQYSYRP